MINLMMIAVACVLAASQALAAPTIQVWYNYDAPSDNPNVAFGRPGRTQTWLNVIGNVQSDVGIASLTYRINGGPERSLVVGPNQRRLVEAGDFNVEVDPTDPADLFFAGANLVDLKATDNNGGVAAQTVTVDYAPGHVWPYPYTADWQSSTIQDIESIAHVVDGKWKITAKGIRTIQTGYDRTIALGDWTWDTNDMAVTVPFTVHSDFSGIGFGIGWQGHIGSVKPRKGWPGTFAWVRGKISNPELNIMTYDPDLWEVVHAKKPVSIALNTTYLLKSHVAPVDSATSNFCIKLWRQGTSEPSAWALCSEVPYRKGSVLLVAYNTDATFGNVTIGPLSSTPPPTDTAAPAISAVQASSVTTTSATITWTTNEASNSVVNYGTTSSYGSARSDAAMVTSHSINLTGLSAGTTYHYRVKSTDASGNTGSSSNLTFTTNTQTPVDTTAPVIGNVRVEVTETDATVTWDTNEASDSRVDYGTTTDYGSTVTNAAMVTSHSVHLTGLATGTTYYCRLNSKDGSGNAANSMDLIFTPNKGLIAYWPMNSGTGTTTPDASGNGYTATLVNGAQLTADGSVQLDGVDDHVNVGRPAISGNAMTVAAWVRSDDLANCPKGSCSILSKASGFSMQEQDLMISTVKIGSQTRLRFRLNINGRTTSLTSTSGSIRKNRWLHIAAVYNGRKMQLYQNGVQVGGKTRKGSITLNNGSPIWIGGNSADATSHPWKGRIDEVRFYNYALTKKELVKLAK